MKHKKDIGEFLEEKLQDAKFSPNDELWSKIDDSLDYNNKRKKMFLLYFSITSLLAIFLLLAVTNQKDNLIDKNNNKPIVSDEITTNKNDSLEINSISEVISSTIDTLKEDNIDTTTSVISNTSKKIKTNKKYNSETKVTSTYYYSNSNEEKIITKNSEIIDSLLKQTDSISSKIQKKSTHLSDSLPKY